MSDERLAASPIQLRPDTVKRLDPRVATLVRPILEAIPGQRGCLSSPTRARRRCEGLRGRGHRALLQSVDWDQVSRLYLDGSSKFPTFLIPTIRAQLEAGAPIEVSALALAGWCQYLVGTDDAGREIDLAADPNIERAKSYSVASIERPVAFLGFSDVFGNIASNDRFRGTFERALIVARQGHQGSYRDNVIVFATLVGSHQASQ